jgi:mRNA interferase MazF
MTNGELWWVDFGIPYGNEPGYTRPALIIQDDIFNQSRIGTIVVIPLTTNLRLLDAPGNFLLRKEESKLPDDSVLLVAQVYAIDRGKFLEKISKVSREIMDQVEVGVKLVLGFN